jgi:hypothetical protein
LRQLKEFSSVIHWLVYPLLGHETGWFLLSARLANLENGLLHIALVCELPDEMKQRSIAIQASGSDRRV